MQGCVYPKLEHNMEKSKKVHKAPNASKHNVDKYIAIMSRVFSTILCSCFL